MVEMIFSQIADDERGGKVFTKVFTKEPIAKQSFGKIN